MSPTFLAARESIAVISGSSSDNATTPEGGNASESSSPEKSELTPDVAINVWSSGGAPKETGGVPHSAEVPAWSDGTPADCGVLEGWGTPLGEALTVILKSPVFFLFVFLLHRMQWRPGCRDERQIAAEGPRHVWHRSLLHNSETVMSPQEEHEPSTKASSACWMPRHVRQQSWSSWGTRYDHIQKRAGDKTSLKDAITRVALLEKCSFSAEARRGPGHHTHLVWLSAGRLSFSLPY